MKKIWKGVCAVFCALACAIGFASCGGKSAYEIAVENGKTGAQTEAEWIESLKGANGKDGENLDIIAVYEAARANGYQKDLLSFIKEYLSVDLRENNDVKTIANNMTSVVSIYCYYQRAYSSGGGFWGQTQMSTKYEIAAGSGVVIDVNKEAGNALILTNYHVLYDAEANDGSFADGVYLYPYGAYRVFNPSENKFGDGLKATYVGGAMDYDVALVKVEGSELVKNGLLTAAEIGSSDDLAVGEKVYAVGNPDGAGMAVTNGIVSVASEYIDISALDNRDEDRDGYVDTVDYRVIRTSAAINGGNSGGGLFDADGKLIGIVNAKNVGEETDNMGYALPISQVMPLVENILDNGGVAKAAKFGIYVAINESSAYVREDGTLGIKETFCVTQTMMGGAAFKKLSVGDTFKWMQIGNGEKVEFIREYQLHDELLKIRKGDVVKVGILNSEGNEETVEITFDKDAYFTAYA